MSARGYIVRSQLLLGGNPTVYRQLVNVQRQNPNREGQPPERIYEFDEAYLPIATTELQRQYEESERLSVFWAERAVELQRRLSAGDELAPPTTEQARRKPREGSPRRMRCPGCRLLWKPGKHDTAACLARTQATFTSIGSGYPKGGVSST